MVFHAWILGIGALLADVIYMALIYLGVIHFLEKDIIKLFLWSFGAFVLIYTGIESLKMRIKLALVILKMTIQLLKASFLVSLCLYLIH